MTRAALFAILAMALALPAVAQGSPVGPPGESDGDQGRPMRRPYANPSAGIAADLERARLTGEKKGRWYALRQTAAPDAVMFVPQMVLAQPWLKARSDAAAGIKLRPSGAWASCDGSLIVTRGARRDGDVDGWYTTVWQRQPDGAYRWVFDHGGPAGTALSDSGLSDSGRSDSRLSESDLPEPDMIEARVAECPPVRPRPATDLRSGGKPGKRPPIVLDPAGRSGRSADGTMTWHVAVAPDGSHRFTAAMRVAGTMQTFRDEQVAPGVS